MRILCTNHSLINRGGSESYLETIAPALRALGHRIDFFTLHADRFADTLRADGFTVFDEPSELDDSYDVIHAQHATAALAVRAALPDTPMAFASHSWFLEIEDPPQDIGIGALIALNDRVADRLRAMPLGTHAAVHRLFQPIAVSGFEANRVPIRETPQRAVVVSRRLRRRMAPLEAACAELGIELVRIGDTGNDTDPEPHLMQADIVFGVGRSALEGMALARAVFAYEESGTGGWIDAASYPALEPTGFMADGELDVADLVAALRAYTPELGSTARELVIRNHDANLHAAQLVGIYADITADAATRTDPVDLAHRSALNQRVFDLEQRARAAEWRTVELQREVDRLGADLAGTQQELEATRETLSWRLTAPLRRLRRGR